MSRSQMSGIPPVGCAKGLEEVVKTSPVATSSRSSWNRRVRMYDTEPLRVRAQKTKRQLPHADERALHRPRASWFVIDRICTRLGIHPTEVYPDFCNLTDDEAIAV